MLGRRWRLSPSSRSFSSHLQRRVHKQSASLPTPSSPPSDLPLGSPSRRLSYASVGAGAAAVEHSGIGGGKTPVSRRVFHVVLISLTGGFALSALNDLAIFHGCSSKAIEKASQNQEVVEAIGEPIVRGPWYDASLAVGHRRNTVACKFPVSGPKGNAILKIKAVRTGDDTWFSFLRHNDWDILISEALLQNEHKQTSQVILIDNILPSDTKWKNSIIKHMEASDQEKQ